MIKLLKNLRKREIIYALICITLVASHVWLELRIPDYMSGITRLVQTEGSKMSEILEQGGMMILCAFISLVCNIVTGFFSARVASGFSAT